MIVNGASLTVVKDTPSRQIPKLPVPIALDYEGFLRETETLYPGNVQDAQRHFGIQAAFDASISQTDLFHLASHWTPPQAVLKQMVRYINAHLAIGSR